MAKQKKQKQSPVLGDEITELDVQEEVIVEEVEFREWNGVQIQALPKVFVHAKLKRVQVWRSENVAVYGIYSSYFPGEIVSYEAFRILKMPTRSIMGKEYPPAEKAPNDEKWGIYGFDCGSTLERAMTEYVPRLEALNYNGPKWKD